MKPCCSVPLPHWAWDRIGYSMSVESGKYFSLQHGIYFSLKYLPPHSPWATFFLHILPELPSLHFSLNSLPSTFSLNYLPSILYMPGSNTACFSLSYFLFPSHTHAKGTWTSSLLLKEHLFGRLRCKHELIKSSHSDVCDDGVSVNSQQFIGCLFHGSAWKRRETEW